MTIARAEGTAATAVPSPDLAAALRGAGLAEVDDSPRRRAEYSSDASNYRVLPCVVAFPRHADEAAAALDVARRAGVPLTSRGGGTSIAGNSVGPGIVLDFSRHMNRVLAVDPEARTAAVEPGAILDAHHRGRGRSRAAVRPGSLYALAGDDRRLDRQQLLRLAGAEVRAHGRQRGEPGPADRRAGSGSRPGGWSATGWPPRPWPGAALDALVRGPPRPDPDRVRPVHPAGLRLLPGAPAAGERRGPGEVPGRQRGHPRRGHRRDGRSGAVAEGGGAGRARLPRPARSRRGDARAAAARAGRGRGHGRAAGGGVPRPPGRGGRPGAAPR